MTPRSVMALPFSVARSDDEMTGTAITTTTETIHGLLILREDEMVIQWRLATKTERRDGLEFLQRTYLAGRVSRQSKTEVVCVYADAIVDHLDE